MIAKKNNIEATCVVTLFILVGQLFVSCHESYPYLEGESTDTDHNVQNKEVKTSQMYANIPILPSMSDPVSHIVCRGSGFFNTWEVDSAHWGKATFRTFAFQCNNSKTASVANYSSTDTNFRPIYNQITQIINAAGENKFYDDSLKETIIFFPNNQKRYKFFTVFTDNTDFRLDKPSTKNILTADISGLDGTQDVIHGFAYHTEERYQEAIDSLTPNNTTDAFLEGGKDYLYNAVSGERGIQPMLHLHHLLSRFNFNVRGAVRTDEKEEDYNCLLVLIDKVVVEAPSAGTLTIADDTWEEQTYEKAVAGGELINYSKSIKEYTPVLVEGYTLRNTEDTQRFLSDWNLEEVEKNMRESLPKVYHHVASMQSDSLTYSILLPSIDKYHVVLKGKMLYKNIDEQGKEQVAMRDIDAEYTLRLSNGEAFLPGKQYSVMLYVYGPTEIKATVAMENMDWVSGDEGENGIELGKDEDEDEYTR